MSNLPHKTSLNLLACQVDIPCITTTHERDAHLAALAVKVRRQLDNAPADVVVLPELASIDYSRATFAALDVLAESLDGASFQTWARIAVDYQVSIVYGFARRDNAGFYIAVGVVNPQGQLLGHYDKLHLAQYGASMEKEYFTAGDHLLVFDVHGLRLAPIICYDIRIPELARTLVVQHGVDAIIHCGAYYRDPSFHTWHDFAITRALENQCYLVSVNRAGPHYGNSIFCAPWHDETALPETFAAHAEEFRRVTLCRAQLDAARQTYSFLADRLPDYAQLRVAAPKDARNA